jgi:hypothetical protein
MAVTSNFAYAGPLRLDPHAKLKVSAATLAIYRSTASTFCSWCYTEGIVPITAAEFDCALIEFKNDPESLTTKYKFTNTVAALEFFFRHYRGHLPLSKGAIAGWETQHQAKHTVPCGETLGKLYMTHMCARGHPRLAVGMLLQTKRGLRPTEMLRLQREDLVFPEESNNMFPDLSIRLGARVGTKSKREQYVIVKTQQHQQLLNLLREIAEVTPRGQRMFPYSIDRYRRILKHRRTFA